MRTGDVLYFYGYIHAHTNKKNLCQSAHNFISFFYLNESHHSFTWKQTWSKPHHTALGSTLPPYPSPHLPNTQLSTSSACTVQVFWEKITKPTHRHHPGSPGLQSPAQGLTAMQCASTPFPSHPRSPGLTSTTC